jgi:hypothetical protein
MNERFFPESKGYEYSECRLSVTGYDNANGKGTFVGANQEAEHQTWFKGECVAGHTYYTQVFTPWKSFVNQVTFAVYGLQEVSVMKILREQMIGTYLLDVFQGIA